MLVYEDQALFIEYVYEWFGSFREGWESISDKHRSGRPVTTVGKKKLKKYNPETKRQNMQWSSPALPRRKKVRAEKSRIETMLITFFDGQ
ncbi:hypothetical protein TNCV_4567141 [Trichonephila clavipes]|nr:hypothetical protein TNCV_4567141 [Trichonephila clavipes]